MQRVTRLLLPSPQLGKSNKLFDMNCLHNKKRNNKSGQSLFEVVIALGVSALIIIALVSLVSSSIRNATFSRNNSLATAYAQEATEWLRGERDNDIVTFMTKAETPTWCMKSLSLTQSGSCFENDFISQTLFKREVAFECLIAGTPCALVQANVRVFWEDSQGVHAVTSSTSFSDWRQR